ncbi:uncharacterized protein [Amphiura filiformis]|uniref:uncharacterized protein n=1 Tax=Amphiura filiformis TaxID=82378 RepID=UPI003B220E59
MESFEQDALRLYTGTPPRLWLRFVDDTLVVLERSELENFFHHINDIDENIKFTQELCKDSSLAFLDCLITVKGDGSLSSKLYRKPTHTDHYLQFVSHHPLIHKLGVIRTLQYRADTIISETEQVPEEKDHIEKSLKNCGYPNWAFLKANKKKSQDNQQTNGGGRPIKARATLPFISGTSERVKKHRKAYGIAASFKPGNTLRGKLVLIKDKQPKEKSSNLVYGLVCAGKDCTESYVGETKQVLKPRVNQHRRPSTNEAQNSAVYLHLKESGHSINIEDATILDREEQWHRRGIKEAIWERVESPSLNKSIFGKKMLYSQQLTIGVHWITATSNYQPIMSVSVQKQVYNVQGNTPIDTGREEPGTYLVIEIESWIVR